MKIRTSASRLSAVLIGAVAFVGTVWGGFDQVRERNTAILDYQKPELQLEKPIAVTYVDENLIKGGYTWAYPAGGSPRPGMTDAEAHEGEFSLEVELKHDAWSGGAVCSRAAVDLSEYHETGILELWMKGSLGGEVANIGLMDDGMYAGRPIQTWMSSRSYTPVKKDEWRRLRIPLKQLGNRGSYWSDELNARVFDKFNWAGVTCFNFDIDKNRFPSYKIWIDDVKIYKQGYDPNGGGENPYPWTNENREDHFDD